MRLDTDRLRRNAFDGVYRRRGADSSIGHVSDDPLIRYLRDRRLYVAMRILRSMGRLDPREQSALVVCGGPGGEGAFLKNTGFGDVTVSDFSPEALRVCELLNPDLKTKLLNAEELDLPDGSYDVVLAQDALVQLARPVLAFTEMLRVARKAVILIEPRSGLVGRLLGRQWNSVGGVVHHVFRWDRSLVEQTTRSYLIDPEARVVTTRMWDHNLAVGKVVRRAPSSLRLPLAKSMYALLSPVAPLGNIIVGVVLKSQAEESDPEGHENRESNCLEPA